MKMLGSKHVDHEIIFDTRSAVVGYDIHHGGRKG